MGPMESLGVAAAALAPPPRRVASRLEIPANSDPSLAPRFRRFGCRQVRIAASRVRVVAVAASASASTPPEATSELTEKNVDRVLDEVRPYLIADGGDVAVVSVDGGVISLKLQGACGSCPSSTTTMKMGIKRVLKEKFGEAVKDVVQVSDDVVETTVEAVNNHLEILRPAIANYGGSVQVLSVDGENCLVEYEGPDSIGSGIKAAIKEKFPDITTVILT